MIQMKSIPITWMLVRLRAFALGYWRSSYGTRRKEQLILYREVEKLVDPNHMVQCGYLLGKVSVHGRRSMVVYTFRAYPVYTHTH